MPDLPVEVEHLWEIFLDLNGTRSRGFSANPISFAEIEAYCRLVYGPLSPWEIGTLLAVDQAVLGSAGAKGAGGKAKVETDAKDGAEVGALFRGMGAKKAGGNAGKQHGYD